MERRALVFRVIQSMMVRDRKMPVNKVVRIPIISVTAKPLIGPVPYSKSTSAVMSVVMLPMWLLSGALFPIEGAAAWLEWVMRCNPVTYAMVVLRQAFYVGPTDLLAEATFVRALAITATWTGLTVAGSAWIVARSRGT